MILDKILHREVNIDLQPRHIEAVNRWSNEWTPDVYKLGKYQHQLVFVCDEFMSDRRMHFVIQNFVVHKVVAFTLLHHDFLIAPDGRALPFRSSVENGGLKIKGELLCLRSPDKAISMLDKLYMRGVHFNRSRTFVIDPYRPFRTFVNGWNDYFFEDGTIMPSVLQGKKLEVGDEITHTQTAWMYTPTDRWTYHVKFRPEQFHRVPSFEPKKEKSWLSRYFKFQTPTE